MKNVNFGGFLGGLVGLAVSVVVVGYAWRMSQNRKNTSPFNPADVKSDEEKERVREMEARGLDEFGRPKFMRDEFGMPRVNQGMTFEQQKQQDLAIQQLTDDMRRRKMSRVMMSGDGFFDGVYN